MTQKKCISRPEILSPCGSYEALEAALRCGADAVYVGGIEFSARRNAKNFSHDELKSAVQLCHKYGAKLHLALNTCILDSELEAFAEEIRYAADIGVDALIVQDLAALCIIRDACPQMPIHASTQMTLHTESGVLWAKTMGFERVVLSRELPKEKISKLSALGIQTEVFVHGALCMSVSGQCYMSALIGTRSANRGLCAGTCRLPFRACKENEGSYALSLKDVSLIDEACSLGELGVASLKIEGRMKRAEYCAAATDSLRRSLNKESFDTDILLRVFSRSGFTKGYYTGSTGKEMFGTRSKEDAAASDKVFPCLHELYRREPQKFPISFEFNCKRNERISLTASDGISSIIIYGEPAQPAVSLELTEEAIYARLSKLGGTLYYISDLKAHIDSGLSVSASALNSLRRQAAEALDVERINRSTVTKQFDRDKLSLIRPKTLIMKYPALWVSVASTDQLSLLDTELPERIIIPLSQAKAYIESGYPVKKAVLSLPRFTFDEAGVIDELSHAHSLGFSCVECTNLSHIPIAAELDMEAIGGFGLNVTNSLAAWELADQGLNAITLSFELKAFQAGNLSAPVPTGCIIYGRLPSMLTVNCPIQAEIGCKECRRELTDRLGSSFPILCKKERSVDYFELLNSKTLVLSDKLNDFCLDYGILHFTVETAGEAADVFKSYVNRDKPSDGYTRGLYYRGID